MNGETTKSERTQPPLSQLMVPSDHDIVAFFKELQTQTDRGVAVLGVAFIDYRISEAIRSQFPVAGKSADKLLGKDDKGGDLSYEEKCLLAHSLGIAGDVALKDLKTIGEIRNKFAHRISMQTFSDPVIAQLCNNLQSTYHCEFTKPLPQDLQRDLRSDPKSLFITVVHQISTMIFSAANQLIDGLKPGRLKECW
jgi:hypothetical protein